MHKLMVLIQGDFIAPRFDLATEILIVRYDNGEQLGEPKLIIIERPSDESLCQMAVEENISDMICGGIEEVHFNFLVWKKVTVLDGVIGSWRTAVDRFVAGTLRQGEILRCPNDELLTL